jgi:hypothetical protein
MKRFKFEIDPYRFYQVGKYMFTIIAVIGLIRVVDTWNMMEAYDIFSSLASTIFQFILAAFFASLQGKQKPQEELSDEDVLAMSETLDKTLDKLNLDKKKDVKKG